MKHTCYAPHFVDHHAKLMFKLQLTQNKKYVRVFYQMTLCDLFIGRFESCSVCHNRLSCKGHAHTTVTRETVDCPMRRRKTNGGDGPVL